MLDDLYFVEKRAHPRFPVSISLICAEQNLTSAVCSHTRDIGAQGLGIASDQDLPVGTEIHVCIEMPDTGERIERKARVVWSRITDSLRYWGGVEIEGPKINSVSMVLRTINYQRKY